MNLKMSPVTLRVLYQLREGQENKKCEHQVMWHSIQLQLKIKRKLFLVEQEKKTHEKNFKQ